MAKGDELVTKCGGKVFILYEDEIYIYLFILRFYVQNILDVGLNSKGKEMRMQVDD